MKTYMPPTLANIKEWMSKNSEVHEVLVPRLKTGITNVMIIPMLVKRPMTTEEYRIKVEEYVCAEFGTQPSQLRTRTRKHDIVFCRQLIYKFVRESKKISLKEIGSMYGYDHASIIYGIRIANNRIETEKFIREKVANIQERLSKL